MAKLTPYFEAKGKKYEIKRTRFLEIERERIAKENQLTTEEQDISTKFAKLLNENVETQERLDELKKDYFQNVRDKEKKEDYLAFKEYADIQYAEYQEFLKKYGSTTIEEIYEKSYIIGKQVLFVALSQKPYELDEQKAQELWEDFEEHIGISTAKEWIRFMMSELFGEESEEENPFLAQAKAKAEMKANQRNGIAKIMK